MCTDEQAEKLIHNKMHTENYELSIKPQLYIRPKLYILYAQISMMMMMMMMMMMKDGIRCLRGETLNYNMVTMDDF